jgi:CRISPR-associated protein Cmr2
MASNEELFKEKLERFFHDSADKPFVLLTGESHENRAKDIASKLNINYNKSIGSDIVASSMERFFLPKGASTNKQLQVMFGENPEFVHPLSGNKFKKDLNLDKNIFKKAVDEAIENISKINFNNNVEKFLYIYSYLKDDVKSHTPEQYKKYWDIAPADTRLPTHTIFDHLKTTSSLDTEIIQDTFINNSMIFIFSLGPVQEFISKARKTQDLYWGSFILSYLTWIAIEEIIKEFGPDSIIFPELTKQPLYNWWLKENYPHLSKNSKVSVKIPTIPNRFFAILPTRKLEKIQKLNLEAKVKQEYENLVNYSLHIFDKTQQGIVEKFKNQSQDFPYVYWIAFPFENDDPSKNKLAYQIEIEKIKNFFHQSIIDEYTIFLEDISKLSAYTPNIGTIYGWLYSFSEKSMGSRKNIRNFKQFSETGRKCSICGGYNPVVYRLTKEEEDFWKKGRRSFKLRELENQGTIIIESQNIIPDKYLAEGEGLCSICFTKRTAEKYFKQKFGENNIDSDFPSTAEISLKNLLKDMEIKQEVEKYKSIMNESKFTFDYELLYEENLNENYFNKFNLPVNMLDELKDKLKDINDKIQGKNLRKSKYYAIIKLDGDDMGKWLSGEKAPELLKMYHNKLLDNLPQDFTKKMSNKLRPMTPSIHSTISKSLSNYSLNYVSKIVEEDAGGKVIYSGGDDVLALINLEDLFDVMVKLRATFSGHIDNNKKVSFKKDAGFIEYDDKIDILMGKEVTASMGVVIAHYKEDLRDVINRVNISEEIAKNISNKNAFNITLLLHSGKKYSATAKWYDDSINYEEGTVGLLKRIISFFKKEIISSSFLSKLKASLNELYIENQAVPEGIFINELRRLVNRSIKPRLEPAKKDQILVKVEDTLTDLYHNLEYNDFINLLSILLFLNKGDE